MYLKSVEKVITLGKLIGLLFLFCLPLLSIIVFETPKNTRNDLARPVMGTIFLVYAKSRLNTPLENAFRNCTHKQQAGFSYMHVRPLLRFT